MEKKIFRIAMVAVILGITFLIPSIPSYAKEDVEDLKKQIEALKAEVGDLKAAQNPRVTTPQDDTFSTWGDRSSTFLDPFSEMQQMQDRMDRLFRDSLRRSGSASGAKNPTFYEPDLDIRDNKDHYIVTLDLPGMDKDKINIEVKEHDLVISGERNYSSEDQNDQKGFYRMERRYGSFSRRIPLPENATPEGLSAKYDKGVLEIKISKKVQSEPKEKSKRIEVK
jgi:HSP20 family protein